MCGSSVPAAPFATSVNVPPAFAASYGASTPSWPHAFEPEPLSELELPHALRTKLRAMRDTSVLERLIHPPCWPTWGGAWEANTYIK